MAMPLRTVPSSTPVSRASGAGLRICDKPATGYGGELGATRHQLSFPGAPPASAAASFLPQAQHLRARQAALLYGQINALAAASPAMQWNCWLITSALITSNRAVLNQVWRVDFRHALLCFPSVAGCHLGSSIQHNHLATTRQDEANGRCHRQADAAEPQRQARDRKGVQALASRRSVPNIVHYHLEDIGSHAGSRIGWPCLWGSCPGTDRTAGSRSHSPRRRRRPPHSPTS